MTRLDIFISIASYKAHGAFIWMSAAPCLNTRRGHAARAQFHGQMEATFDLSITCHFIALFL